VDATLDGINSYEARRYSVGLQLHTVAAEAVEHESAGADEGGGVHDLDWLRKMVAKKTEAPREGHSEDRY
jgi:hypothetical protein